MVDSADELVLRIEYSKGNVARAVLQLEFRRGSWVWPTAGAILTIYFVFVGALVGAAVPLTYLVLLVYSYYRRIAMVTQYYARRGPITFKVSSRGVIASFEHGRFETDWTLIPEAHETKSDVFMLIDPANCYFILKRQMNEYQLLRLREILRGNVKKNILLMDGRDLAKA